MSRPGREIPPELRAYFDEVADLRQPTAERLSVVDGLGVELRGRSERICSRYPVSFSYVVILRDLGAKYRASASIRTPQRVGTGERYQAFWSLREELSTALIDTIVEAGRANRYTLAAFSPEGPWRTTGALAATAAFQKRADLQLSAAVPLIAPYLPGDVGAYRLRRPHQGEAYRNEMEHFTTRRE